MAMKEQTNTDLQKTTQKTTDRSTRTSLKLEVNSGASEGFAGPAPLLTPMMLLVNNTNII